ncbi:hypothetical protein CFC21_055124 [Triticum aestivum]|uniref:Dirigent protein n=3 Tax=Triticum TaxID=4564 RepID=A0A9R0W4W8_TRITD|nr:uncharacterized protein LOC123083253 [Triticum aestivum]KAF7046075.1 hypothetical protein CFC21_055124 [Triticum aestivum]VAH98831.1 unnamed protein product [Triticum turgidum subsp. durum]
MACTPTDGPTMDVPMVHRSCPPRGGGVSTNFKVTCDFGGTVENAKVNVSKLYLRQIFAGCNANQSNVIQPNAATGLGKTVVNNWGIYDGPCSQAKLVAHGHGMHTLAGKWSNWFTLVFVAGRFKGSTLQVMGANDDDEENEWAIVGGTGEFSMARGVINKRVHSCIGNTITQELTIEFFCRMKEVVVCPPTQIAPPIEITAPTKIHAPIKQGPWGGMTGGSLHEMGGKSRRLESVTIYHHGAVEGLQFSYVDEDGQIHTTDTWGVNRGLFTNEIKFGPSEFVKQISGAGTLGSWLSQLKIVTNTNTYGPFGTIPSQAFSYTVPENATVVGFFAETLNVFITRIGVYTIPK